MDESGNNVDSWEDFQVESSPSNENEDNAEDLQVNGPTQDDENQPQAANEESNPTMWNSCQYNRHKILVFLVHEITLNRTLHAYSNGHY